MIRKTLLTAGLMALPALALAQREYVRIDMEIDVARPAEHVWSRVGGYCDLGEWLGIECEIISGDGGVGTVRSLIGGRVIEVLVGETDLAYGYAEQPQEGRYNNLYHGFMEAKPVSASASKIVYTLVYDVSNLDGQAARDADVERRRSMFENALQNMKRIAEAE